MVAGAALSEDLTDDQWLAELEEIGEEQGYFSPLGDDHAAVFIDRSQDVLFVCFESLSGIRASSETGLPLGFEVCDRRGWSHLTLIAKRDLWYRDRFVYGYFDRLVDEGFFEDFDHVIFYGAGMCGYAAAAFSVVAPGATVIAVAPQATLRRELTEWDSRFPETRRMDFSTRYGYAPQMLEAAEAAYVLYDPDETEDAMHAALFQGPNIHRMRYRRGRSQSIDADLRAMGAVSKIAEAAANGALTPARFARELRARKKHVPYLRGLLARVLAEDRPYLTALLCRAVLATTQVPRFQHFLEEAETRLVAEGRRLPAQAAPASAVAG